MDDMKRTSEYRKMLPFIAKASGDVGDDTQGEEVQALVQALNTHKSSVDHDGRYSLLAHDHDADYLGITAKAADSDLLDAHDSAYFAAADHDHDAAYLGLTSQAADSATVDGAHASATPTAATIPIADANGLLDEWVTPGGAATDHGALTGLADDDHPQYLLATAKAADSDLLDSHDTAYFATAGHDHSGTYLGLTAKAADSDTVDGAHASATPSGYYVPIADSAGKLAVGWIPLTVNADKVDGSHASATPTASTVPIADAGGKLAVGWMPDLDGWTPASGWNFSDAASAAAGSMNVPSGALVTHAVGDRLKFSQDGGSTYKYAVVYKVFNDNFLYITAGSDYTFTTAGITNAYYSHQALPVGFPDWFGWTGVVLSQGASTNIAKTVRLSKFKIDGRRLHWRFIVEATATGTAGSNILLSLPVVPVSIYYDDIGFGLYDDSDTATYFGNYYFNGATGASAIALASASVTGRGAGVGTNPALTVASGDRFDGQVFYEI